MTLIASHRGGSLQWPENSPTAFRNTAALAVDQVEFDIHPTTDGEIVVIHDATLDRTTGATGPVAARTLAELRAIALTHTGGEHMLTLGELAALFQPTPFCMKSGMALSAAAAGTSAAAPYVSAASAAPANR